MLFSFFDLRGISSVGQSACLARRRSSVRPRYPPREVLRGKSVEKFRGLFKPDGFRYKLSLLAVISNLYTNYWRFT